jgi:hypothetical protein
MTSLTVIHPSPNPSTPQTPDEIWRLPAPARIAAALGSQSVPLGNGCVTEVDGKKITVQVPQVCPGKLLASLFVFMKPDREDIKTVPVDQPGKDRVIVDLDYAIAKAPEGCGAMLGGRTTNLLMLREVVDAIVNPSTNPRAPGLDNDGYWTVEVVDMKK